uniref:Uncharacterized protein n=1 Tax=Anguilla anguilla TaxID=7936 RepID=A0A0E9RQE6_ANGAN
MGHHNLLEMHFICRGHFGVNMSKHCCVFGENRTAFVDTVGATKVLK